MYTLVYLLKISEELAGFIATKMTVAHVTNVLKYTSDKFRRGRIHDKRALYYNYIIISDVRSTRGDPSFVIIRRHSIRVRCSGVFRSLKRHKNIILVFKTTRPVLKQTRTFDFQTETDVFFYTIVQNYNR